MNILVTGACGQLGRAMRCVAAGTSDNWLFTDIIADDNTTQLDITDLPAIRSMAADFAADVIVNCAAYTNVDAAEQNVELAERLNAEAPANLATVMNERGGLLVHISTDYVFGKEPYNTPCTEERTGTPTGVYGLTKLHGEQAIIASGCRYVILRTAWLYSEHGKNFVRTMLSLMVSHPTINVVFDQVGTPTYALDLARAIEVIISKYSAALNCEAKAAESVNEGLATEGAGEGETTMAAFPFGIYHFSDEGVCSWYDFACQIREQALEMMSGETAEAIRQCKVKPCHSSEFPSPVVRPAYSVLDKTRIKETFDVEVPYWVDSLRQCLRGLCVS